MKGDATLFRVWYKKAPVALIHCHTVAPGTHLYSADAAKCEEQFCFVELMCV